MSTSTDEVGTAPAPWYRSERVLDVVGLAGDAVRRHPQRRPALTDHAASVEGQREHPAARVQLGVASPPDEVAEPVGDVGVPEPAGALHPVRVGADHHVGSRFGERHGGPALQRVRAAGVVGAPVQVHHDDIGRAARLLHRRRQPGGVSG